MKNLLTHLIIIVHLLVSSTMTYGNEEVVDKETVQALKELKSYCEDVAKNPGDYKKNAKDKSVAVVPVETSPGVVKYDTLIKIDHENGPDYISCFQMFSAPLQPKSLFEKINAPEINLQATQQVSCRVDDKDKNKSKTAVANLEGSLKKVTEKLTCDESKKTTLSQCSNNMTYCGLENLHLAKVLKFEKPKDLKCDSMLEGAGNVGECMATFIRGAFDEITDTLKMLVIDGPKWIYSKTIGKFFSEPAVKQMENIGSMEAVASSTASDKAIKDEKANPSKSLLQKISDFTEKLILDKGASNYGCTSWSSGIPGVGTCMEPAGSWECTNCKQKAMAVCGIAGYAAGMVIETAVLAAPVGVIAGTVLGIATKTSKVATAAKTTSKAMQAAKEITEAGVRISSTAIKVLAPIGKAGYKVGKGVISALKLIPGAELTAAVLAKPFKLWMKTDDLLTSKVWNLTYHGSKAYTQTLAKTGSVALAKKSAATASKLNQVQKSGEALLKTQADIKKTEEKLSNLKLSSSEKKSAVADQKKLTTKLEVDQKRYDNLSSNVTAKEIEDAKFLESEHAAQIADKYNDVQKRVAASAVKTEDVGTGALVVAKTEKAETAVEVEKSDLPGVELKLTPREASADQLAKIIAVDEETQKLISDPIIAQYIYLNHFAPVKEQAELKVALQDIVNSAKLGDTDIFKLVNEKLASKLKDPEVQAKVKAAFDSNDKTLRPSATSAKLYETKAKVQQFAAMPTTLSRLKKITDEGFAIEVLDEGLFHFYGATQLGIKDSQLRPWINVKGGFSAIRPNQIENISPELWSSIAHFASETEAPIHGYSTNSGDALRGLIPSVSRFMGKNEEEYLAFTAKAEKDIAEGNHPELFCTNVWCTEEKRHETAVQKIGEQVTGVAKTDPKTYEADKAGNYLDPEYGLKHLVGRNSSEWNANSVYLYMRSHTKEGSAANTLVDNVRRDETKHMAIFSSAFKYFYGDQPGLRTKGMIQKIAALKKEAATSNSSGDVLAGSVPTLIELGVTHLFVENKVRQFMKSVPLKTMEKVFDSPVKTLRDLETVPLTAEKKKAILEMNEVELKKRENLERWTPKQRKLYTDLKKVEKERGPLIESLIENLFDGFRGAEVPGSEAEKLVLEQIKKLRTGLDAKTNALVQMSLRETFRDYQIMNNKFVRSQPDLKVVFKNAQEGFIVEKKGPGEATVLAAQKVTDSTFLLRVKKPAGLELTPGAAVRIEVDTPGGKDFRVLSLASSPDKDHVEFAVGISDSTFKQAVMKLKPGQTVTLNKARGAMSFDPTKPVVMIAGGIGITPFRSMIQYAKDQKLSTPMHLYYANKTQIPFGAEFTKAAETTPELNVTTILSKPDEYWKGQTGRIDEPFLAKEVPKLPKDSKYYIVGPPAMVTGTQSNLIKMGVKPEDIQIEIFAFEKPEGAAVAKEANATGTTAAAPEKAVCKCYGVGKTDIIKVIKGGAKTMDEIAETTGATRGCGGCACAVEDILKCEMKAL